MDKNDVFFFLGMIMMTIALYFIYPPLALLIPGAIMVILAVVGEVRGD